MYQLNNLTKEPLAIANIIFQQIKWQGSETVTRIINWSIVVVSSLK